jgi:hypothetical protein
VKIVADETVPDLHEHVLDSYFQSGIAAHLDLIVPGSDEFGMAAVLAFFIVATLATKLIAIADVFLSQRLHVQIFLDGGG